MAARLAREHDQRRLDRVGHGGGVVGEHLGQAGRRHLPRRLAVPRPHDPVDGRRLLAAVAPRALPRARAIIVQGFRDRFVIGGWALGRDHIEAVLR